MTENTKRKSRFLKHSLNQWLFFFLFSVVSLQQACSSHFFLFVFLNRSLYPTYEIMAAGTTSSSTSWLRWLRTACRFFSRTFMLTDCCCRVWISLLMDDRSLWKPLSMPSIRWEDQDFGLSILNIFFFSNFCFCF